MIDYANNQNKLWQIESNCNETHIFSTIFDIRTNQDYVTIEGAMYSGRLSFDLIVSNSFFVHFSSGSGELTKPGFLLTWECRNNVFDSECCSDIEASGFSKNELNGIYSFTGNFINGRHWYVGAQQEYEIWFDGQIGWSGDWVIGLVEYRNRWATTNKDPSCPAVTKIWKEYWSSTYQWTDSTTAIVQCLSGDNFEAL